MHSNSKKSNSTKFIQTDSLSKHSCFRDIAEIQAVHFYFKKFKFYKSTSSSGKFLHSFNIAESSKRHRIQLLLQEHLVSHTPFVCTQMDQGLMQNQGHSSRTRILRGRSNKLLENKFYIVYIDYGLIKVSFLQTIQLRKGDVVISTKLNILELTFFHLA